ncbi:MAG TPA: zeta toxin family protein [Bryobacteraceae bacterium]|nr:zeta toxin family protein [Bryobacteraceae bacterium]
MIKILTRRPLVVALAGPNGAGKSSFYRTYLRPSGLRFVNADVLSLELQVDAYEAAKVADRLRRQLIGERESFIFETIFSDPIGDKLAFLKEVESSGYTVLLFFIGIDSPQVSDERVAIRVSKGGHDVPAAKIMERFPRVMHNLQRALKELSNVRVYDNSNLTQPYRLAAIREDGHELELYKPIPAWLCPLLP